MSIEVKKVKCREVLAALQSWNEISQLKGWENGLTALNLADLGVRLDALAKPYNEAVKIISNNHTKPAKPSDDCAESEKSKYEAALQKYNESINTELVKLQEEEMEVNIDPFYLKDSDVEKVPATPIMWVALLRAGFVIRVKE